MQLDVIGLGVSQPVQLSDTAQQVIAKADLIIGSARQLALIAAFKQTAHCQQQELPKLAVLKTQLMALESGIHVVVLASGDPLWFGIGRWLQKQVEQVRFHPNVSSIQAACHQLGLSVQDCQVVSLHGRPLASLRRQLKSNRTLIILTDQYSGPDRIAQEAVAAGFEQSQLYVCEAMGYGHQRCRQFDVSELNGQPPIAVDPLHVSVLKVAGTGQMLPEFPGFEDELFVTDKGDGKGMLTKREVRLQILSMLQPSHSDVIWDIGAGCGSVSIELSYWAEYADVHAIEHHPQRLACLQANREKFGVLSNLRIHPERADTQAQGVLAELPRANKIFIGGSDGDLSALLHYCWLQLPYSGVLVVSAVMEPTRLKLMEFVLLREAEHDCQLLTTQVSISRGERLAGQLCYKPALPVTLVSMKKVTKEQHV